MLLRFDIGNDKDGEGRAEGNMPEFFEEDDMDFAVLRDTDLFPAELLEEPDTTWDFEWFIGDKIDEGEGPLKIYGVNGKRWNASEVLKEIHLGEVSQWKIISPPNSGGNHPFHLHTNHFQIVDASHGLGLDYVVGEWRDTVSVPDNGWVLIRILPERFVGHSMAHCHIFAHVSLAAAPRWHDGWM